CHVTRRSGMAHRHAVLYKPANPSGTAKAPRAPCLSLRLQVVRPAPMAKALCGSAVGSAAFGGSTNNNGFFSNTGRLPGEGSPNEGEGGMIIWGIFWGAVLGSWFGG